VLRWVNRSSDLQKSGLRDRVRGHRSVAFETGVRRRWLGDVRGPWLFLLPAGAYLGALSIYPLFELFRMSVSDVTAANINRSWRFVGVGNFRNVISSSQFSSSLVHTVIFVIIITTVGLGGGVVAALALRGAGRVSGFVLGMMIFIWALPPVVNGSLWRFLFDAHGLIDSILLQTHLTSSPILWLVDPHLVLVSVALVTAWTVVPFAAVVYRAAILDIPPELTEAALIDGARSWQELRHIVLPLMKATTFVLGVLIVVYGFRSFDYIYVMTYGGPGTASTTLPFLSYEQAFVTYAFGVGAATAVLTILIVLVLGGLYARNVWAEEQLN